MLLPIDTRRIQTRHFEFMPNPRTEEWHGARRNPLDDFSGDNYAARLFVGFNVGAKPRWKLDDLMGHVREIRREQRERPDVTYITTRGVFTHKSGKVIEEDGAQIIIFAIDEEPDEFIRNMGDLAEQLVQALDQEEVFLEIQKNGVQIKLLRARP